jgi:hypothetical protein
MHLGYCLDFGKKQKAQHLTRTRSATAGEGAHSGGRKGWSHGKLVRTPASGSLPFGKVRTLSWLTVLSVSKWHSLVRLFVIHAFNRRDCRLDGDWIKRE